MFFGLELDILDLAVLLALIALAGTVDSIAGGGGLITVPAYLAFGLPPGLLLGTNKAVSTLGTSLAVWRFHRSGAIRWRLVRWAVPVAAAAAAGGAWLSRYQSRETMTILLLVVVPLVLALSLRQSKPRPETSMHANAPGRTAAMSAVVGGYDGFFGPGTGSFLIFGLTRFLHLGPRDASATARVINFASNIGALAFFATRLQVHVPLALLAAAAAMAGNYLGSHLVLSRAERVVRPVFICVLSALLAKLLFDALR